MALDKMGMDELNFTQKTPPAMVAAGIEPTYRSKKDQLTSAARGLDGKRFIRL